MSSHHNDLATWAGKARARGMKTIELDVDTADEISEIIVEKSNRIGDLEHELRTLASRPVEAVAVEVRNAFNEALNFALDECQSEPLEFLRAWREGDTSEWPEFRSDLAPAIPEEKAAP